MQFNTYLVAGALIAAGLVNSPPEDPAAVASLLDSYDVHRPAVTAAIAAELGDWGRRLRPVFGAAAGQQADLADALLVAAKCRLTGPQTPAALALGWSAMTGCRTICITRPSRLACLQE